MLYVDYARNVFRDYEKKKAAKLISSRLTHPTTANLREECKALCNERLTTRDQGILKTFFGQIGGDVTACVQTIENYDPDKFKPLVKFLKKEIKDTNVKNVDLLAWLIDYKDRPYGFVPVQPQPEEDEPEITDSDKEPVHEQTDSNGNQQTEDAVAQPQGYRNKKWWKKDYLRKAAITVLILSAVNVGAYTLWTSMKSSAEITGNEKCMYWADDHYQPVSCNQKMENSLVIALDSQRLNHFKRITTKDTITMKAIGNVWYAKVNGSIEFYTSDGFHPIDIRLRLKPITQFIINKYIHPNTPPK